MRIWALTFFIFVSMVNAAFASTFVGNGGNSGDIEVQVTKKEIVDTLTMIAKNKSDPELKLCTCYPALEGHPICQVLKKLTPAQVQYCAKFTQDNSGKLGAAISSAKFKWSNSSMEVAESSGLNSMDAVANFGQKQITLQQERFLSMKNYERVFLLSHEIGHLIEVDGKPIQDVQPIGPFTQSDGGRQLLNSMAATVVMEAIDTGIINKYNSVLRRSQGRKSFWLDLAAVSSQNNKETFSVNDKRGTLLGVQYFFTEALGLAFNMQFLKGETDVLTNSSVTEKLTTFFVGGVYRLFPFQDPLSILGQSNFRFALGYESLSSEYELKDDFISVTEKQTSSAPAAYISYYVPIQAGFWGYAQVGYSGNTYKIEIPFKTIEMKPATQAAIGVSYGF